MANREIGVAPLVVYLLAWWGFVVAVVFWLTSNHAPGAPELAFKDAAYYVTSKLEVVAKNAVDPDGDHVEYTYAWTKDGEPVADMEGPTIPVGRLRAGQVWKVTVTPDDGSKDSFGCGMLAAWRTCAGDVSAEAEITIANTPPQARVRVVNGKGEEVSELAAGADLGLLLGCYDPDVVQKERDEEQARIDAGTPPPPPPAPGETPAPKPDPCTYTVKWYAGNAPALPTADLGAAAAAAPAEGAAPAAAPAVDPNAPPPEPKFTFTDGSSVKASDLKASKTWKIHVVANDGEIDGPISEIVLETPAE